MMKDCRSFSKLWSPTTLFVLCFVELGQELSVQRIPLHFNTNCVVFHIINCMFKKKFKLLDACNFNVIIFCKDYLLFIPSICIILYWINCFISHVCTCQFFSIYSAKFNISEGILKYMKYRLIFFFSFWIT